MKTKKEIFYEKAKKIADLQKTLSLLRWDQEVMMPRKGSDNRSEQIATISSVLHQHKTDPAYEEVLRNLQIEDNDFVLRRNIEESLYEVEKQKKLPSSYVYELDKAISLAFQKWLEAREANDFKVFAPQLTVITKYKLQEAEYLGYDEHPYNALMNDYDKGLQIKEVDRVFAEIGPVISSMIREFGSAKDSEHALTGKKFDVQTQMKLSQQIAKEIGYDMDGGRLDMAPHPFSTTLGPGDVRITTRFSEDDLFDGVLSSLHEAGHAMYEQGLPAKDYGLPSGQSVSLSIHESQSRLYENHVGRSMAYAKAYLPVFRDYFPRAFSSVTEDELYKAMNVVSPSLIRTASDEISYHLHIIIRYELEKAMIGKELKPAEAGNAWREKYRAYMGISVPDDNSGVLQDIHWSHGSLGYFPTYSFGSFYAAQFFHKATEDLPGLVNDIENRQFSRLLSWLRENIHSRGRTYNSGDLCKKVTGKSLNPAYFLDYARKKFTMLQ